MNKELLIYILELADNALILGHRLSEWCGHGPVLEQDIAITNTALDHLGQARNLYQYAAELYNQLPENEQRSLFHSATIINKRAITEDDLAYLRDAWDFKNALLVEQPNTDWAYTIARSFFYDTYAVALYTTLQNSKDKTLAAIAAKSLKEALYHRKWSSEWVIRLGDGTDISHEKMQNAINALWEYTKESYIPSSNYSSELQSTTAVNYSLIEKEWLEYLSKILKEATITLPENSWMQSGGKEGIHSEHLGYILSELQYLQRAYPDMEW